VGQLLARSSRTLDVLAAMRVLPGVAREAIGILGEEQDQLITDARDDLALLARAAREDQRAQLVGRAVRWGRGRDHHLVKALLEHAHLAVGEAERPLAVALPDEQRDTPLIALLMSVECVLRVSVRVGPRICC
jgi:hypothetical protein